MKLRLFRPAVIMIATMALVMACGLPSAGGPADADVPMETESAPAPQPTVENEPPADAPAIGHKDIPVSFPENQSGEAGDFNSSKVLENSSLIGGDRFTFGRFERPFNANTMDTYFPEIDIIYTQVFQDDLWIYGRMYFNELTDSSTTAQYAVEIDTNLNGKAEWLVVAGKPASTEWTVNSVRVYQDSNLDVGGEMPTLTDNPAVSGDGFETLFFDQGTGENPDTAWVRISPDNANIIEFAINRAALASPETYLINFWAGSNIDPAKFDINDMYTHEEAGAADAGLEFFHPIKAIAEIDNTCRMAVGFQPTGREPGLCQTYVPQPQADAPLPSGGGGGCTASFAQILGCSLNSDPSYSCSWNSQSCGCDCTYVGPN